MPEKMSLNEVQNESKKILFWTADLCDELGLKYCLSLGTLLGAVRHNGFIPWDDDIDIMMPREDYNKLVEYFKTKSWEIYPYKLFCPQSDSNYPYMISRVSDIRYTLDFDNEKPYGLGLFVDIYPFDGLGQTEAEADKRNQKAIKYTSLCYLSTRIKCKKERTTSKIKLLVKYPAFLFAKLLGKNFFFKKLDKMSAEVSYKDARYVGCLVWGTASLKRSFPKEWFEDIMVIPFEEKNLKIPTHYDDILSKIYGNYMELPPIEKRISHHFYEAYKK